MASRSCPHCSVVMTSSEFDGHSRHPASGAAVRVHMDQCPKCQGMWFDQHELDATMGLGRGLKALAWVPALGCCDDCGTEVAAGATECSSCGVAVKLPCPACDQAMVKHLVLGLQLDRCEGCMGVWCDGGELQTLHEEVRKKYVLGGKAKYARCLGCDCVLDFGVTSGRSAAQLCLACAKIRADRPLESSIPLPSMGGGGGGETLEAVVGVAELAFELFALIDFD
jgi:Zn-finger nucleic acid-binding protein